MRRAMVYETRPDTIEYGGEERVFPMLAWWCTSCDEALFEGQPLADRERAFLELKAEAVSVPMSHLSAPGAKRRHAASGQPSECVSASGAREARACPRWDLCRFRPVQSEGHVPKNDTPRRSARRPRATQTKGECAWPPGFRQRGLSSLPYSPLARALEVLGSTRANLRQPPPADPDDNSLSPLEPAIAPSRDEGSAGVLRLAR